MIITWLDIARYAYAAGFRGEALRDAIAISQPESGRNPDAENRNDPNGGSFGLMQINGVHDPDATGTYPNKVPTQAWIDKMHNPLENFKAAYQVWLSNGKKFDPWGTYKNGLHVPYQQLATAIMYAREQDALKDSFIAARDRRISELELQVSTQTGTISDRDATISGLRTTITERDASLALCQSEKTTLTDQIRVLGEKIAQAREILN